MIVATAATSIVVFLIAFQLVGVVRASAKAVAIAQSAIARLRDASLDDGDRERTARSAALELLGSFVSILTRGVVALGISLLPIWLAGAAGLVATDDVLNLLSRWDVILITSIVIVLGYVVVSRLWTKN